MAKQFTKVVEVDKVTRKYEINTLYLEGSVLKLSRLGDDYVIESDVTPTEAAELAAEFGKTLRIFTYSRRFKRKQKS